MHATTSPTLATNKPGAPRVVAAAVALSAAVLVGAVIGVNIRTTGTPQSGAAASPAQGAFDADRSATVVAPLNVDPPEDAIKAALAAPLNVDPPEDAINAAKDRTFAGPADVVRNLMAKGTGTWVSNGRGGIEYQLDKTGPFDPMAYYNSLNLSTANAHDLARGAAGWWAFDPSTSGYVNYADQMRERAAAASAGSQVHSDGFYLQEAGKRRFGAMHRTPPHVRIIEGNDQGRGISIR
jgi:hypothetical protein